MRRVMVTGIAGMIGARTARALRRAGLEVVGVDNLNDHYDPRLKHHRLAELRREGDFEFHEADVEDRRALAAVFRRTARVDAIVNLAGRAAVRLSLEDAHAFFATNTMGNLNLLECARDFGVGKFVLASTSSLYAGEKMPFVETAAVNQPISPYAASKKAAEASCYTYHYQFGIDCSVLRYFTVYGPAGRPDMAVFRFIRWIDDGQPIEVFGDGAQARDLTYVDDVAHGTRLALRPLGFEAINLGGGRGSVTVNDLIAHLEERLGKPARRVYRTAQRADMLATLGDCTKAERLLGWRAELDWREGLDRSVEWYLANRELARAIRM